MIRGALQTFACAALYGFALGSAHSELYATRNLAKFPLLILVTAVCCSLCYWLVALSLGVPLTFTRVQRATWQLFRTVSVLLASLSPVAFFLARVARATDDGKLGRYDELLALNVALVAFAGVIALAHQVREIASRHSIARARVVVLVSLWLALTLGVGGQAAFYMRPFFGFPATRGNTPPFFLGSEPDVRGARNFYEAIVQTLWHPPLPSQWPAHDR